MWKQKVGCIILVDSGSLNPPENAGPANLKDDEDEEKLAKQGRFAIG